MKRLAVFLAAVFMALGLSTAPAFATTQVQGHNGGCTNWIGTATIFHDTFGAELEGIINVTTVGLSGCYALNIRVNYVSWNGVTYTDDNGYRPTAIYGYYQIQGSNHGGIQKANWVDLNVQPNQGGQAYGYRVYCNGSSTC